MTLIIENIKLALSSIRSNKMRSFLTMLGMIIGISAVISIVSLGDTMQSVITDEYANLGQNLAYVYIVGDDDAVVMFNQEDIDYLKEVFGSKLEYIGSGASASGNIIYGRHTIESSFNGLADNPSIYEDLKMVYGKMFSNSDIDNKRQFIIIEKSTAMELFGTENCIGKTIKTQYNDEISEATVTGVYENDDSALMKLMSGMQKQVAKTYMPETVVNGSGQDFWSLYLYNSDEISQDAFKQNLTRLLSKRFNVSEESIIYSSAQEEMKSLTNMMSGLSLIVGAIAAISLIVGGIGIMNIMLVSVTERTREIGIRKALGARTVDILLQFLVESAIISAAGGLIGTLLGIGVVALGGAIVGIGVVVKPMIVVVAVAFAAIVGIFFGLYPAAKAAKADPIEALRYE